MATLTPWQQVTVGCGLMLAAASDIRVDPDLLSRQVRTAIDSVPEAERGHYGSDDGTWTAITLVNMPPASQGPALAPGTPAPVMAHLPLLPPILEDLGGVPHGAYILRQPPQGYLRWHFDPQSLHLPLCRLLLTVAADPAAFTWIGHEKLAFPPGTMWTGDFAIPHQVENPADRERLVIALDYPSTDRVRAHFPAALYADGDQRRHLAQLACEHWAGWRNQQAS